jgi:hypothetical protein
MGTTSYEAAATAGASAQSLPVTVNKSAASVGLTDVQAAAFYSGSNGINVSIPNIAGVATYALTVPGKYLTGQDGLPTLTLDTDIGTVTMPSDMLSNIPDAAGRNAGISIGLGDASGLSDNARAAIGTRPIVQLTLKLDGQQTDWNNPGAPVTVRIPYIPTAEELLNPESIVVWYIDGSGSAVMIPNGHYDSATGCVSFETTHFSRFAAGYSSARFDDVPSDAWYAKAVRFIAARNITASTGTGIFSPGEKLTRGQFIVMLLKAYGISPDAAPADNFADAGSTYYTGYLASAKRLGIAGGVGGNLFAPDREITRQELFTLLHNALKVMDQLPTARAGKTLGDFTDAGLIAAWARDAMAQLVESGTIAGSVGLLDPEGTTTRAEIAQVLYNLLSA